jgi:hypothetical protein
MMMRAEQSVECLAEETDYKEKTCPSTALSIKIPHDLTPVSNSGRRGGIQAINRLSYGKAIVLSS